MLSISYLVIGLTAVGASTLPPWASIFGGAVSTITGLTLLLAAAELHLFAVFVAAAVVCGAGYGLSMSGDIGLASINAPAHHRGRLLSAVFLAAYLVQGAIAFGAGLTATQVGLQQAVAIFAPIIGGLGLVTLAAIGVTRRLELRRGQDALPVGV